MSAALWMAVGIAGAAGAALAGWYISRRQMPALRALDAGFQCPDMRFHYTPQELFDGLDRLGAKGCAQLTRLWWADTGLSLSLLAVMAAAAHNSMAGLAPLPTAMDAVACLRAVADLLENALLAHAVRAYPDRRREGTVQMAAAVTAAKWCLTGLWVVGLFGGLVLRAARL